MDKPIITLLCFVSVFCAGFILETNGAASSNVQYFLIGSENISVEEIQAIPKAYNQCYVSVSVHNSSSHKFGLANATVTVLSGRKQKAATIFTGYSQGKTDQNGLTCLIVQCHEEGLIFVEKSGVRIFSASKSDQQKQLPPMFSVDIRNANEVVHFYSFVWGTINGHTGPVYTNAERDMCFNASMTDYHFVFSYISVPDKLVSTPTPIDTKDPLKSDAWYYEFGTKNVCYLKLNVKAKSTQLSIHGYSHLNNANGEVLGLFKTGLKYDISASDITSKAACLEFRCPTPDLYSKSMNTFVNGTIVDPTGKTLSCCPTVIRSPSLYNVTKSFFSVTFKVGNRYGPSDGVYMASTKLQARARCFTGHDYLGNEYSMDVFKGYAIKYDCTSPCKTPPFVG